MLAEYLVMRMGRCSTTWELARSTSTRPRAQVLNTATKWWPWMATATARLRKRLPSKPLIGRRQELVTDERCVVVAFCDGSIWAMQTLDGEIANPDKTLATMVGAVYTSYLNFVAFIYLVHLGTVHNSRRRTMQV